MRTKTLGLLAVISLVIGMACTKTQTARASYEDEVKNALKQAELTDVTVSEDKDKNTITLGGTVHSGDAKEQAARISQSAAGSRMVVNEISVQPVGAESEAKDVAKNTDDAIEKNYKASLIAQGLDKQSIDYKADNGVLTLTGSVKSVPQKQEAQKLAQSVPNVQQVVNQLEVKR
jgi:osmotically-inducible protein OsmY